MVESFMRSWYQRESPADPDPDGIRQKVKQAFKARIISDPIGDREVQFGAESIFKSYHQRDVNLGVSINKRLQGPDEEIIYFDHSPSPHIACVDTPEKYKRLLRAAIKVLYQYAERELPDDVADLLIQHNYEHEIEHAQPALGEPNLKVWYGVGFSESSNGETTSFQPMILLEGSVSRGVYRRIVSNTSWKSKGDDEALK